MIILTKIPPLIALAGNGIPVTAREEDITGELGASNTPAHIRTNKSFNVGDYFKIESDYISETFTCVSTVTNPANQFLYNNSSLTFDVWALRIVKAIKLNINVISNYKIIYNVSAQEINIYFDAHSKTAKNNLSISFDMGSGVFYMYVTGSNYNEEAYNKNHRIVFKLFTEKKIDSVNYEFKNIAGDISVPLILNDNYGYAEYDLKRIVKHDERGHFSFPEITAFQKKHDGIVSEYKLFAYSDYNYEGAQSSGAYSSAFYLIHGKISDQLYRQFNTDGTSFYDKLVDSKMFLSFAPLVKETDIYTPEKLYFLFMAAVTARFMVREYDLSGNGTEYQLSEFDTEEYDVYEFQTSFLKVRQGRTSTISKYEVWLQNTSGTLLSEVRTYVLNYNYYQYARYLLFKTRLGVYETIRLTGKSTKRLETEKTEIQLSKKVNSTFKDRTEKQIDSTQDLYVTVNSGYFSDDWRGYFASELAESLDVFWLKNGVAYAINIESSRLTVDGDNQDLPSFELSIKANDLSDEFHETFDIEIPVEGDFSEPDFQEDFYNVE